MEKMPDFVGVSWLWNKTSGKKLALMVGFNLEGFKSSGQNNESYIF